MKADFRAFWKKMANPPAWVKALTFLVALLSAVGALLMLLIDYDGNALSIVAYSLFGVAGTSLAYSVYLLIPMFPKMKRNISTYF